MPRSEAKKGGVSSRLWESKVGMGVGARPSSMIRNIVWPLSESLWTFTYEVHSEIMSFMSFFL